MPIFSLKHIFIQCVFLIYNNEYALFCLFIVFKAIPYILDNRDVVAMARTGSGKSAAFLIPMFQRLLKRPSSGKFMAIIGLLSSI